MSELGEFLAAYAGAYETYDAAEVARFVHCPCLFLRQDECVMLDSREAIDDFLRSGLEVYRASGCARFHARLVDERLVGPRFALIDVEWSPESARGERAMHFFTTYNLRRDAGRWQVTVITRHDR